MRLFNSVFKTEPPNQYAASRNADMGDVLSADPPQPDQDTRNMNKVLANLNNVNAMNAGKIFMSIQKKNAQVSAQYEKEKAPEWQPAPLKPKNDTLTKTLKKANAAIKEEKAKEKNSSSLS